MPSDDATHWSNPNRLKVGLNQMEASIARFITKTRYEKQICRTFHWYHLVGFYLLNNSFEQESAGVQNEEGNTIQFNLKCSKMLLSKKAFDLYYVTFQVMFTSSKLCLENCETFPLKTMSNINSQPNFLQKNESRGDTEHNCYSVGIIIWHTSKQILLIQHLIQYKLSVDALQIPRA